MEDKVIYVPSADNFFSRAFGLMFRDPNRVAGMFFDLGAKTRPLVWNMGMRFPIAIIWFSGDSIVGISRLPRFSLIPRIIASPSSCDAFLELSDFGFSDETLLHVRISRE